MLDGEMGSAVMRLGVVILPELSRGELTRVWRHAEALGFDHAWTYDHLAWRSLRDSPWYAAVPTLAAAALATERIRIGPLVASPNFRHPVSFARELIALDDLSEGRLTLGIGAGGVGWDATILGQEAWSARERADRFDEFVTLTDLLLRQRETSWRGRYYAADEARSHPGCVQRPRIPFAVAASGPRGIRLAARFGEHWVTTGDRRREGLLPREGAGVVAAQIASLEDACRQEARDPKRIGRMVLSGVGLRAGFDSPDAFQDTLGLYAEAGVSDFVVHWPRAAEPHAGDLTHFERVISAVRAA
jgi:alkanesulfonate monooxygenase SsuD/methylene tetrahydromethanopterin reductase-like flavin-dependent oxidoreductase (luciferase family)